MHTKKENLIKLLSDAVDAIEIAPETYYDADEKDFLYNLALKRINRAINCIKATDEALLEKAIPKQPFTYPQGE